MKTIIIGKKSLLTKYLTLNNNKNNIVSNKTRVIPKKCVRLHK